MSNSSQSHRVSEDKTPVHQKNPLSIWTPIASLLLLFLGALVIFLSIRGMGAHERGFQEGREQGLKEAKSQLLALKEADGQLLTLDDLPVGQTIYCRNVALGESLVVQEVTISRDVPHALLRSRKALPAIFRIRRTDSGKEVQEILNEGGDWRPGRTVPITDY